MIKKFDEFMNENIFDGIGKRSKGGIVRKEDYVKKVDLGLPSGTIWAACNLGASSPEEYGDFYAWGETEPKDIYNWNNYKFGTQDNLIKYNKGIDKTVLDTEDDAAHVVLGGKWHMPTKEQIQELLDNTTNENSELNGVKGRLFKSKINDNTLFFPYCGIQNGSSVDGSSEWSFCWSSSIHNSNLDCAMLLASGADGSCLMGGFRYYGFSVRGVLDKK